MAAKQTKKILKHNNTPKKDKSKKKTPESDVPGTRNEGTKEQAEQGTNTGFLTIQPSGGIYTYNKEHVVVEPLGYGQYLIKTGKGACRGGAVTEYKSSYFVIHTSLGFSCKVDGRPLVKPLFIMPPMRMVDDYCNGKVKACNSKQIFTEIKNGINVFQDFPQAYTGEIVALCIMLSWLRHIVSVMVYLFFEAKRGAGKTNGLEIVSILCYHGIMAADITRQSLARLIDAYGCSPMVDELDEMKDDPELLGIFRRGYRKGNPYIRCQDRTHEIETFNIYGFKCASIYSHLEPALMDRAAVVPLRRSDDGRLPVLGGEKFDYLQTLSYRIFFWYIDNCLGFISTNTGHKIVYNPGKNALYTACSVVPTPQEQENGRILPLQTVVPLVPLFHEKNTRIEGSFNASVERDRLYKNLTKEFSKKELNVLNSFVGRNTELTYALLKACKLFNIEALTSVDESMQGKKEYESVDDSYYVDILRGVIRDIYKEICREEKYRITKGLHTKSLYYPYLKVYERFLATLQIKKLKLMKDNFMFARYMSELGFEPKLNILKQRNPLDETETCKCIVFDESALVIVGQGKKDTGQDKTKELLAIVKEHGPDGEKVDAAIVHDTAIEKGFKSEEYESVLKNLLDKRYLYTPSADSLALTDTGKILLTEVENA